MFAFVLIFSKCTSAIWKVSSVLVHLDKDHQMNQSLSVWRRCVTAQLALCHAWQLFTVLGSSFFVSIKIVHPFHHSSVKKCELWWHFCLKGNLNTADVQWSSFALFFNFNQVDKLKLQGVHYALSNK